MPRPISASVIEATPHPPIGGRGSGGWALPPPGGVQGNSTRAIVPEPRSLVRDSVPPAASTRARYDARPMWPPSRLRSAASASIPRPSSATSKRAVPRSCERVTVAEVASACLTTLLSSSLAAAYSRPSTEVRNSSRQPSSWTAIAGRPAGAAESASWRRARASPACSSTAGCSSAAVERSSRELSVSARSRRANASGSARWRASSRSCRAPSRYCSAPSCRRSASARRSRSSVLISCPTRSVRSSSR